jgi:hypothetical protein
MRLLSATTCSRFSNCSHVHLDRYATNLKRRWGRGHGGHFGGDWDRVGYVGSGGQECGLSGPSLRQERARVGQGRLCRMAGSSDGHLGHVVAGRGRGLHRRVALRRYGACWDGLGLLCVVRLSAHGV